jgi:peptidase M48-like protein
MIDLAYTAHGLTLSLAWFVAINILVSGAIACAAHLMLRRITTRSPAIWLALRLAPAGLSTLFVMLLFVPSYWKYEPREAAEGFDVTLTTIAVLGMALLVASAVRGIVAWRTASRRVDDWIRHADKAVVGTTPCFIVDNDRPMIALSGIWRHRLVVTRGLVEALTGAELAAAIAHELGHRRAWDNVKRLAIRSTPDVLGASRVARTLERRWAAAAELAADSAAGRGTSTRCALASALVKVARMMPLTGGGPVDHDSPVAEPISTLVGGGEIASRVRRLLDDRRPPEPRMSRVPPGIGLFIGALMVLVTYGPVVQLVHEATEALVRILP